ncbi:hypothetical protein Vadar_010177 [Vaccinium darrowii]|uniref:Uncharacterized protein n=1 Tax=Vaccinium darrowii TaxID=229202 RepID=A0ACB7Z2R8_9ERIC|nr:hypothetical protein Vadar_010177 [Vaccinium darrowii]
MPVSVLGSITVAVIGLTIPYDNGQGRLKDGNMVAMEVLSAGFYSSIENGDYSHLHSLYVTTKQTLTSLVSRSYASTAVPLSTRPSSSLSSSISLLLSLVAANFHRLSPATTTVRGYSTRRTSTSLNDPKHNWSNRPPKETILLDGCDFEHWLVVMEKPEGDPTRDDIIDSYIKTLAEIVGSEDEARMKIYSVSTRHYFAFGALVSEELSVKLKELRNVRWVLPDSYLDVRNKDYGGEPFINGQAVPYDPKYHQEWVRNNIDAKKRHDRPRRVERPRIFDTRQNRDFQMNNHDVQNPSGSNLSGAPAYMPSPPNIAGPPPGNMGGQPNTTGMPQNNMGGQSNMAGMPQNNMGGGMPQNNIGGGMPRNNMGRGQPQYNTGGVDEAWWLVDGGCRSELLVVDIGGGGGRPGIAGGGGSTAAI